jgi:hypothetical protein
MNMARNRPRRRAPLLRRQLVHQDGDEDDVVDAQHQLQGGEGEEGDDQFRAAEDFEHGRRALLFRSLILTRRLAQRSTVSRTWSVGKTEVIHQVITFLKRTSTQPAAIAQRSEPRHATRSG